MELTTIADLTFGLLQDNTRFKEIKISHCRNTVLNDRTTDKVATIALSCMRAED